MKYFTLLLFVLIVSCADDVVTVTKYVEVEPAEVRYTKLIDDDCYSENNLWYQIPVYGYNREKRFITSYISRVHYNKMRLDFAPNYEENGLFYIKFGHDGSRNYQNDTLVVVWTNQSPL